ncbi:MAG: acyl-ACP--UDP-N-acetylglucosamine O-acyltransferase [bacterium]|nr:acyl-ACP--UDP-N-acetylglucosamine O-acyltransferase [bacterium]
MKINPTAHVDANAQLADDVEIGAFTIIGPNVSIGSGTVIRSSCVLEGWTEIGENNVIHAGVMIGGEPQDFGYQGERSFVKIGSRNILREYVTVHRGAHEDSTTIIGDDNMLMAYVHVAHNCFVGNQVTMANYAGMAGYSRVDDQAVLGGLCGLHQFVRIGRLCMVGGLSKVNKDVPPFCMADGNPMRLFGTNFRGMRRRDINAETRNAVKAAFNILTDRTLAMPQAIEVIERDVPDLPEVREFVEFLRTKSRMGVLTRAGKLN